MFSLSTYFRVINRETSSDIIIQNSETPLSTGQVHLKNKKHSGPTLQRNSMIIIQRLE